MSSKDVLPGVRYARVRVGKTKEGKFKAHALMLYNTRKKPISGLGSTAREALDAMYEEASIKHANAG